ncbi:MAG: arginine decarboxylase, pyruvoyl-dependent [Planctomycetales bacterium]|nr:arginine decarboxylase, pyruvoyl-dependent [Planctomycetales bacterium]
MTNPLLPTKMFLTHGVGVHGERLQSFEMALRDAGLGRFNLVQVSSILPPGCSIISRAEGEKLLQPGQILFVVMARKESNEPHRMLASSVGLAVPRDNNMHGYLSEHHSFGQRAKDAGDYAEDLAAAMLASTLGVEFDEQQSWDDKRKIWRISDKIVTTRNVTQSAVVKPDGRWTTAIAAAAFLID